MLKRKLFLAIVSVILLIIAAGAYGVWLLRDHVASFERVVTQNFELIKTVNDFRHLSATLEASYLTTLAGEEPVDLSDDSVFRRHAGEFEKDLVKMVAVADKGTLDWEKEESIHRLAFAVRTYLDRFETLFEPGVGSSPRERRTEKKAEILRAGYAMADEADELLGMLESAVTAEHRRTIDNAHESARLMAVLTAVAVGIVLSVYLVLSRRIIRPLGELGESLGEVQRQNFERILPVKNEDEVGQLSAAFNNMAAELRVMKMETDQKMLRLNQESRAILMGFPHPIYILDRDGRLSQANPAAETLGRELVSQRKLPLKIARMVRKCVESGEEYLPDEIESAMLFRPGDREVWYLPRIFRIGEGPVHEFHGWAVVLIDVTRVRWLDDMKTDLLGTVSHEIKTPLTSIRMVLHLLAEKKTGALNETQESIVTSARDDCERLLQTLDNLLQLSRIESGASSLQREPAEPAGLIEDAANSFLGHVEEASLNVRTEVPRDLPRVLADRHRIGQVFKNLLSNAVKHSPRGGEIVLSAARGGQKEVRFSVIDHGEGVPEAAQDRIFERFYRAPGENGDGTGLGLSICREIVGAHGGRIGVNSRPGQPTEFFFYLPQSTR